MHSFNSSPANTPIRQDEDGHFQAQMEVVFAAFERKPSTMLMVSIETGILRANICRYVAEWQKRGRILLLRQGLCKVSKHRAGYYTTDLFVMLGFDDPLNPAL